MSSRFHRGGSPNLDLPLPRNSFCLKEVFSEKGPPPKGPPVGVWSLDVSVWTASARHRPWRARGNVLVRFKKKKTFRIPGVDGVAASASETLQARSG